MSLSRDERRFLRAYLDEGRRKASRGALTCPEATDRSDVPSDGGMLCQRLEQRGYLERVPGGDKFAATPQAEKEMRPWYRKPVYIALAISCILNVLLAILALLAKS